MKIGQRLKLAAHAIFKRSGEWERIWGNATSVRTAAGTNINESSSLTISALFAALNFLASTLASLPRAIYRRTSNGGREPAPDHPLYDRIHNKPNKSYLTAWQWIYTSIMHKYLWGNWYTYIEKRSYQNQELLPLLPDRTWIDRAHPNYITTHDANGQVTYIPRENVLHIPHISLAGVTGKGIVHYARESLGIVKAQEEFVAHFFGQGTKAGVFVSADGPMKEETRLGLQKDFNETYGDLGNSWKAIFLTGGAKVDQQEIDAVKAQALESRQFSVVEVARWTNLPPHILRELSRATFSNIEQQGIELVMYSLLPITTQIEQAMNIYLFDGDERKTHFIKFELKGLLRGDIEARTNFYNAMLDRGVFNADQVRALEDINPQPNGLGKVYMMPLNMVNKELVLTKQPLTIEADSIKRSVLVVQERTAALRRKITIAYKKQYEAYGEQVVTAEVKEIKKAIKKMLGEKDAKEFGVWLERFYPSFSKKVDTLAAPLLASHAEAILPIALQEIESELDVGIQYDRFQSQYRESYVKRHVEGSQGQLKAVIKEAEEQHEDVAEAVGKRLDEWEEKRPGKIAMRESVRAENAFTRSVFALAGIMKIISVAYGTNCPYCNNLNGKIVGIDQPFLFAGSFQPEGAEKPLIVTSKRFHPPYHDGCDCGIMAVMG